ncbi:MAG: glutathione S-transferase family protein [Granulosicoccus sp.]
MKLYYAPASPFARKVHVSVIELGLQERVQLQFTPVLPGQPNEAYAKAQNPSGKIPALQTDAGDILFDSTIICEYLDSLSDSVKLLPTSGSERYLALTRQALAHGICESSVVIRYETFLRPEPMQWDVWVNDQWSKIDRSLTWFNANPALWQGDIDLAQITLGCALGYLDFRAPEYEWRARYPELGPWFETIETRDSFASTLPTAEPVG